MRRTTSLLVRLPALAALVAGLSTSLAAPASASVTAVRNDYPFRADTSQAADPWGFTKRQCVSFAAFRLAQSGRPLDNATQNWGSAYTWDAAARRLHYPISSRPVVGAIAQWHAGERSAWYAGGSRRPNGTLTAGLSGHVGYVTKVYADGSADIEHYNMSGSRGYSVMHAKAPRYLYVARPVVRPIVRIDHTPATVG